MSAGQVPGLSWLRSLTATCPMATPWCPTRSLTRDGRRFSISYLDPHVMTRIFQVKVLRMLVDEHCPSPEFADRLLTWRHSGFQVYRAESVEPDDTPALERLCASIGRAVLASTRVEYDPSAGAVRYRTAKGAQLRLDALEWIALVIQHLHLWDLRASTRRSRGYEGRSRPCSPIGPRIRTGSRLRVDDDSHGSDPVWAD